MPLLDELLPHLALLRHAQEEPGERDDRDERALEHHQRAREALIGVRRQAEVVVSGLVHVVERRAAPDEDVPDDGRDQPDADDVRELRAGSEPLGRGQRLEDGEPEDDPGAEERDVLDRVQRARLDRPLVEHREVPEHEVRRPDRERDERVREDAQAHHAGQREDRAEHRAGEPGEQAQRREIAEQQVLRHVEREELLLSDDRDRRRECDHEEREAEGEERDPPARHRLVAAGKRPCPHGVGDADEDDRRELEQVERPARQQRRLVHAVDCTLGPWAASRRTRPRASRSRRRMRWSSGSARPSNRPVRSGSAPSRVSTRSTAIGSSPRPRTPSGRSSSSRGNAARCARAEPISPRTASTTCRRAAPIRSSSSTTWPRTASTSRRSPTSWRAPRRSVARRASRSSAARRRSCRGSTARRSSTSRERVSGSSSAAG